MDKSNILSEITLGQIFKGIKDKFKKLKTKSRNAKVKKYMDSMNSHVDNLEKLMHSLYGDDITLPRYTEKDFEASQKQNKEK